MAKFFFKRILPSKDGLNRYRVLKPILKRITSAAIWQVNRRSISIASSIGVFYGAQPVPIQIVMAAITAGLTRSNLPCAVLFTFWSNPFTAAPIYYFNYRVGVWILNMPLHSVNPETMSNNTMSSFGGRILVPLFSGSLIVGVIAAAICYVIIYYWWRLTIVFHKRSRNKRENHK